MIHLIVALAVLFSAASTLQSVIHFLASRQHGWAWAGSLVFSAAIVSAGLNVACYLIERY